MTLGEKAGLAVAQPFWTVAWDVFTWMGHRRFKWHCSVSQIIADLDELFGIASADWVQKYLRIYQTMVAAREANVVAWASDYATQIPGKPYNLCDSPSPNPVIRA